MTARTQKQRYVDALISGTSPATPTLRPVIVSRKKDIDSPYVEVMHGDVHNDDAGPPHGDGYIDTGPDPHDDGHIDNP